MKTATLNGVRYHVDVTGPIDGATDVPRSTVPSIMLCRDLATKAGLETCLHESAHALYPLMSEEKVTQSAHDQARFLWGLGYRHVKD